MADSPAGPVVPVLFDEHAIAEDHAARPLALRAFAFGVRHPTGSRPSVYRIAHDRR